MLEYLGIDNFKSVGDDVFDLFFITAENEAEAFNKMRIATGLVDTKFDKYCEQNFSFQLIPVRTNKELELDCVALGEIRSSR